MTHQENSTSRISSEFDRLINRKTARVVETYFGQVEYDASGEVISKPFSGGGVSGKFPKLMQDDGHNESKY